MRLNGVTLRSLPAAIKGPGYAPSDHGVGIVHLGIGAFHRCHMAVYTDDVLRQSGGDWRILGVSLRSATIRDQLEPQDGLYTVLIRDARGEKARVVGSVAGVLCAPEDPEAVLSRMSDPAVKIISLTVTEKGYCHDPASGNLNHQHPDIIHDIEDPERPRSAIGYLVAALRRRRDLDAPLSILSCDNLPSNGAVVRQLVLQYADLVDRSLRGFIEAKVSFPSTMVDRIVPAMEDAGVAAFSERYGIEDQGVLATESFTQWVIEDDFAAGRPEWGAVGATMTDGVEAFEHAKLRMLNGAHSALAYVGHLSGHAFVHEAMAEPSIRSMVDHLMAEEAAPSIQAPQGLDLDEFRAELQERFDNPALQHRTYQIAMDGSQKLPQRWLGTVRSRLRNGGDISALSLSVAAWIRYLHGTRENGESYVVQDPMAEHLAPLVSLDPARARQTVDALLSVDAVFGDDLRSDERFAAPVATWLECILSEGINAALNRFSDARRGQKFAVAQ